MTGKQTKKTAFAVLWCLCLLLPSVLFFSYQPLIQLGETDSMHLDLSLPLILLAIISLLTLPLLPKIIKTTPKKPLLALTIIPCYTILSLLWSNNPLRTFLSFGVLACLALNVLALLYIIKNITPAQLASFKKITLRLFLATSVIVSIFAWLQCILDVIGVSRDITLLCEGCTYQSFGFPHPSAFAIEPQFFGNLLLAPVFLCYYFLLYHKNNKKSIFPSKLLWPVTIFLTITLFFTFSRGAIYAFLAASATLILWQLIKKRFQIVKILPIILCSAIISLICQGIFAQISPTSDTFTSGIAKSIHHLTLGYVDLRSLAPTSSSSSENSISADGGESTNLSSEVTAESSDSSTSESSNSAEENRQVFASETVPRISYEKSEASDTRDGGLTRAGLSGETPAIFPRDDNQSQFDGYVSESTDFRLSLTSMALATWSSNPKTIFLGVGLGGAGPILYQNYPELGTAQQIVQNEYASLLLEFGLVGVAIIVFAAILIFTTIKIRSTPEKVFFFTLLLAYGLTLFFFSGLPNALHIYLLPIYALLFSKHQLLINRKIQQHNH